jgi:hypothetical protein
MRKKKLVELGLAKRCGAKTISGNPCRGLNVSPKNGRCKFHGLYATGPRTPEGKERSLEALKRGRETRLRNLKLKDALRQSKEV